jgi:hypothetical protein
MLFYRGGVKLPAAPESKPCPRQINFFVVPAVSLVLIKLRWGSDIAKRLSQ